jgi:hypothetical protein
VKGLRAPVQNFTAPSAIGPGEVARFVFNFTNRGNSDDMVNVTVMDSPLNWHAGLDPFQNIRIRPYATQEVSLTVQASVNRNESMSQDYHVLVQIASADRSSVLVLTFTIPVKPVYEWDLTVEGQVKGLVNPYANPVHSFTLTLANKGNTGDEVSFALGGDFASWGKLDTNALSLEYGEKRAVRLAVEVPRTAEVGREYALKITAASVNAPGLVKEFEVSVTIVHIDASVVPAGSIEINGQVWKDLKTTLGTRLNLTVTIRNDGTGSVRGVNVRFYDNGVVFAERNTSTIAPLGTARFNIPWDAVSPGPHIIKAKVDPGNLLGEVNESDNEGTAEVTVVAVPPPPPPQDQGWIYGLALICGIAGAGGGALAILRRRPRYDRELYESIYGRKGDAALEQRMAAERAEIERRASERAEPVDRQAGY